MQVLLREDVDKLGQLGDVVDVAPGYARNYLLPKGIAVPVTDENIQRMEKAREERAMREQEELERLSRKAGLLEDYLCHVSARANEQGSLFGSVTAATIAEKLGEAGFEGIRPTNVSLETPIDETGDYDIEIMLHPDVRAQITVRVSADSETEGAGELE
jgi:large subunit ribosomal protein L9